MLPNELFISHASADRAFVERLVEVLKDHGIPLWYSPTNILGAQQWHDEIGAALRRCDWFLVVLTPASVESMWVKRELTYCLRKERFAGRIICVHAETCDFERLSWVIEDLQIIDFRDDYREACRSLLRIWGLGLR